MPLHLPDVTALARFIRERAPDRTHPFIVALDGRSGAGKSTLAAALARLLGAAVIEGDDFYAGGTALRSDSPAERASACIDWTRQRAVLEALCHNRGASWRAFDWEAFDGRLRSAPTSLAPSPVIVLEGVYAARPELADLTDLKVFVAVDESLRLTRLQAREGVIGAWERQWHEAEADYFARVMPMERFDIVIDAGSQFP